jgi:branched-chain amino acid transport system substrate-binding protein
MTTAPPDPDFTPISPNPYIVGNPVRDRSMFFGREAEFELVRNRFAHSTRGGLLVFCGERRSGKTSILFQILDQRLGPDFIPVLIDMQSMAVANEIEFLTRLSEEMLAALGPEAQGIAPPEFTADSNHSATFQKFVRDVLRTHPDKKLILLFDEYELFENKIDSGLLAQDVLHILASLMEHHPVFLVFTGSQHLDQRRRDYWSILGKSQYKMIGFLERADALSLVCKPVEGRVQYANGTVEAIYRLTAGQPFYTQAICQGLVDQLNERRTNHATREALAEVVDGIINNPLPQMIFLWEALERDEKLVLALLAECLQDEGACARVDDLTRLLRKRGYPLDLDKARIATMLEKLFKSEMLLRDDRSAPHGYSFRMDLWRLWIRRQHSVWQVMREVGLGIRSDPNRRRVRVLVWAAAVVAGAWVLMIVFRLPPFGDDAPATGSATPAGVGPVASYALKAEPEDAIIYLDGRRIGIGTYFDAITAERDHRVRLTASGYADSEIVVRIAAGGSRSDRVALRALFGGLRIETRPPGADVKVDGILRGPSPVTVQGLSAAQPHRVEAALAGYGSAEQAVFVRPDSMLPYTLVLKTGKVDVTLTTEPGRSQVRVDGDARGTSPRDLPGLVFGRHTFSASQPGYLTAETSLVVTQETKQVHLVLVEEPPGILVVQGDQLAQIYIDGVFVVGDVYHSGQRKLAGGTHQVQVVLRSNKTIDSSVVVRPRESATYDFSKGTVTYQPEKEP